jgi:hypothetical protein
MNSLSRLVEKWLMPTLATQIRVTRFSHTLELRGTRQNMRRYVCVEALRPEGSIALFFFRHDDGTWHVFPPEIEHLTIRAYSG